VSVSPAFKPRTPPLGAPGADGALYGREHVNVGGIADPTATGLFEPSTHVIAPLARLASVLPAVVVIDVTLNVDDGEPIGNVSVSVTVSPRVIGSDPALFVTAIVHVVFTPALSVVGVAVFVALSV
jgi:hypothetical protein